MDPCNMKTRNMLKTKNMETNKCNTIQDISQESSDSPYRTYFVAFVDKFISGKR